MSDPSNHIINPKIRLYLWYSLIFFVVTFNSSCQQKKKEDDIHFIWDKDRAVALSIAKSLLEGNADRSYEKNIIVRLGDDTTSILGNYKMLGQQAIFEPLIPFSRGLLYRIWYHGKIIGEIKVPLANAKDAPIVQIVYPSRDTLPANLLKLYLQFSKPMREGISSKYISLIKNNKDTIPDVFLNLSPELWNEDRTVLTIWLDPGRIKRDLIPNLEKGNPLDEDSHYKLLVSKNWQDINGLALKHNFEKNFFVTSRDSVSPNIKSWIPNVPKANSKDKLVLNLQESLDYYLLQETIKIIKTNTELAISGKIELMDKERVVTFTPDLPWISGEYVIAVESRLEDNAGNNLNRPFEVDLTQGSKLDQNKLQWATFNVK